MKVMNVISLIAIVAISTSAMGAVNKKAPKAKAAKAQLRKVKASAPVAAAAAKEVAVAASAPAADTISNSAAAPAATVDLSTPSTVAALDTNAEDQSILSKTSVSYSGVVWGPSAQGGVMRPVDEYGNTPAPNESNMPTTIPTMTGQIYTENALGAGYKASKNISVSAAANFLYTPVRGEHNAIMLDPIVKVSHASLLSDGDFNMNGDFRIYPGVTSYAASKGQIAQFRSIQNPNYTLGRWNFALGLQERYYIYDNSGAGRASKGEDKAVNGGTRYRIYTGPQVNYQASPKLTAWVLYEMEGINKYADGFFDVDNNGTDAEIGVDWNPIKQLTLSPFLDFKTGGKITAETTTINLAIAASLL